MKNIDTASRQVRTFTIIVVTLLSVVTCIAIFKSFNLVNSAQSRIYLLANGKVLQASSTNRMENMEVEIRDHVKTFHQLFFTLDPDDKAIRSNLTQSLYLGDGSVKQEYDNLQEKGYYPGIISGNISQKITVDSVAISAITEPYSFRCYATQKIIRSTSIVSRSLITSGLLREVSRSDNNPHGFLIEKWVIEENRDIQTFNR